MASFTPNLGPANDPSYLRYASDIDVDKRGNRTAATAIEGAANLIGLGTKAAYTGIVDSAKKDVQERVDAIRADFGVDAAAEKAAEGIAPTDATGDASNFVFAEGGGRRTAKGAPPGVAGLGERVGSLQEAYNQGKLSESYYLGRLEAMTREVRAKYPGFREEVDGIVQNITGVVPANALRKSLVADLDRAERARQSKVGSDETFVRQNLEHMHPNTLAKWQRGEVQFNELQLEVAQNQRVNQMMDTERKELQLKKDRREANEGDTRSVAEKDVNAEVTRNVTGIVDGSGGIAKVREMIQNPQKMDQNQLDNLRQTFNVERERLTMALRQKLNHRVYDDLPQAQKNKIVEDGLVHLNTLEKAITDKDVGTLYRTANYLEAQKNEDMRRLLENNEGLRKSRAVGAMDKDGTIMKILLSNNPEYMGKVIESGRQLVATELILGENNVTKQLDRAVEAGKNTGTRELAEGKAIRANIRDLATMITAPGANPEAVKNIAKGGFGPGNENFVNRFKRENQMEVWTTMGSPAVTKVMAQFKDSDPAVWNMYTKWMTDNGNRQFRRAAQDISAVMRSRNSPVSVAFNEQTNQFDVTPLPGQEQRVREQQMRGYDPLNVAQEFNTFLRTMQPIAEANGENPTARLVDVMKTMGLDPNAPKDKPFWEAFGPALMKVARKLNEEAFPEETDPAKLGYMFEPTVGSRAPKDDSADEGGLSLTYSSGVDMGKAKGILDTIRRAEAGDVGNAYSKVYGTRNEYPLEKMTLDQIYTLQGQMRASGSPSTAIGAYQFLQKTLKGLQSQLGLKGDDLFTKDLQDRLALTLLNRRGFGEYSEGRMGKKEFVNSLAMEWAGLPNTTGKSHYDGDGLNKATVKLRDVLSQLKNDQEEASTK
jgi:muramidase (phage lysozyme)